MADEDVRLELEGMDKLVEAFDRFPRQITANMKAAAREASHDIILPTKGLRVYPRETAANRPPTPFYRRGYGTITRSGIRGGSQNLGKKWYTRITRGGMTVEIGNTATYARYVHGDEQARAMDRIGWKQLKKVVEEKLGDIKNVYQRWVNKTLKDVKLK